MDAKIHIKAEEGPDGVWVVTLSSTLKGKQRERQIIKCDSREDAIARMKRGLQVATDLAFESAISLTFKSSTEAVAEALA